jgi:hypothetical protein
MIQNSLLLNYGVPVLDISDKGKALKMVLITDLENPSKLNVYGKSGLRKCVFDIKDFTPTTIDSNKQDLTMTISTSKSPIVYQFAKESQLEHTYAALTGYRFFNSTLIEQQQANREDLANLKANFIALGKSTALLLDAFLIICKYQLTVVKDMSLSHNIPKHYFESMIRAYYPGNDVDNFDHYMKQMGFTDKTVYDQKDLLSFIVNHRLECETQDSGFRSDVI